MQAQRTLKRVVETTGVGLHSGRKVRLVLRPAAANTGIVFRRVDLDPAVDIKTTPQAVGETRLSTTLVKGDARVATIEHLMSALAGLGIDNLYVDLDAEEIPILDGSSAPFVYLIQHAGIELQRAAKQYIRIKQTVRVEHGDIRASLEPFDGFVVAFEIDFEHPAVRDTRQSLEINLSEKSYLSEISRARTFCFMKDVEKMRSMNLGLGGSLDNAIVMDDFRVLNRSMRYKDEFVLHKMLDAIGDLYTLGYGIIGKYTGHKSGHAMNNALARALLEQQECWEFVSAEQTRKQPIVYGEPVFG